MTDYHRGRLVRLHSDQAERVRRIADQTYRTVPAVVADLLADALERHDAPTETEEKP